MKIAAFTRYDETAPSSRYRFYRYRECFASEGVEMEIFALFDRHYLETRHGIKKAFLACGAYLRRLRDVLHLFLDRNTYDIVLIEYELFPYLPAWFESLMRRRGIAYIVDYDDAIFHKYDRHRFAWVRRLLGDKVAEVIRDAKSVIVCNDYLYDYAVAYNRSVTKIPTVVDIRRYARICKDIGEKEKETFVVGWIGSRTTSPFVAAILPILERFAATHEKVRIDLVGFDASLLNPSQRRNPAIRIVEWCEETEIETIAGFDVGVMPLPDTPWSRGKCGFKLIQYMACAKPTIASAVGTNMHIVVPDVTGYTVDSDDAWIERLERLYGDKALRLRMGRAGREVVEKDFDNRMWCRRYIELIRSKV